MLPQLICSRGGDSLTGGDPCCLKLMPRLCADRHRCFGLEAQVSCRGSNRKWSSGVKQRSAVTDHGPIIGFVGELATAQTCGALA